MPGIINQRMSQRVANGFVGGPQFSTRVNELANGQELRNKRWAFPKSRFTADIGAFNEKDRDELRNMLYVTAGQWAAFRFRDPTDNVASNQAFATTPGTKNPVQLVKVYTFGGVQAVRRIQGPVANTVKVMSGSTLIAGTVDDVKGLFTPSNNWPSTSATWSGSFDVWVRFASDYTAITAVRLDLLTANIELLEVYN